MNTLLKLAVSTVVVAASVQADVIMPDFELDLEARDIDQLKEIAKQDINVAFGVDAFTENYRAHMWDIRNNYKHTPEENEIVRYESLKYYNTVYKLILTELARCIFDIKGGMIEYTDDCGEILKCKGGKPIEQYDQSNWNYVVFVNVLNRFKNGKINISENIKQTIAGIKKRYKSQITEAMIGLIDAAGTDISTYFELLDLGKYITDLAKNDVDNLEVIEDKIKKYRNQYDIQKNEQLWYRTTSRFGKNEIIYNPYIVGAKRLHHIRIDYKKIPLDYEIGSYTNYLKKFGALYIRGGQLEIDGIDILHGEYATTYKLLYKKLVTNTNTVIEDRYNEMERISDKQHEKIRRRITKIRKLAERDHDISKYKKIIAIHNILNATNLYNESVNLGGLPDIVNEDGTVAEGETTIDKMKAVMETKLDKYLKLLDPTYEMRKQLEANKERYNSLKYEYDNSQDNTELLKVKRLKITLAEKEDTESKMNEIKTIDNQIRANEQREEDLINEIKSINKEINAYEAEIEKIEEQNEEGALMKSIKKAIKDAKMELKKETIV